MDFPKYFSLEDARGMLPIVQKYMSRLINLRKELDVIRSVDIRSEKRYMEIDLAVVNISKEYHKKMYFYYKYLGELFKMGVLVKDVKGGLVDIYSKHEGREIFLCWKFGDEDIYYWHELNVGFKGRKPISLLEKNKA